MSIKTFPDDSTTTALQAVPDAVIAVDALGVIRYANSKAEELTGYSSNELIGENIELLMPVSERESHRLKRASYHATPVTRDIGERGIFSLRCSDGVPIPVAINLSPLPESSEKIVIATIRDVSGEERRSKEDSLLAEIRALVAKEHEIHNVYDLLDRALDRLFQFDRFVASVKVPGTDLVERVYVRGQFVPENGVGTRVRSPEISEIAPGPLPRTSLAGTPERITSSGMQLASAGLRSWMEVPLGDPQNPSGFLSLRSKIENAYGEEELLLLERVAASISPSFENMRLYSQIRKEAHNRSVMAEISRGITSSPDIEKALPKLVQGIRRLMSVDRLVISNIDQSSDSYTLRFSWGRDDGSLKFGESLPLAGTVTNTILKNDAATIIKPGLIEKISNARYQGSQVDPNQELKSWIATPLRSGAKTIGVLHIRSMGTDAYQEQDLRVTDMIAAQISGPLVNASLYEQIRMEAKELRTLAKIGRIVSSTTDLQKVFERFASEFLSIISVDSLLISLVTPDRAHYRHEFIWQNEKLRPAAKHLFDIPGAPIEQIISSKSSLLRSPETSQDLSAEFPSVKKAIEDGTLSAISVPLITSNSVIGTLHIGSAKENAYSQHDVEKVERVGAQIAGALAISQAHAETLKSEQQRMAVEAEKRELELLDEQRTNFLATVSHELKTPLTSLTAFADIFAKNRDANLTERQLQGVHVMQRSSRRLDVLVNDLQDISRIDAGTFRVEKQEFDVHNLLHEVADEFATTAQLKRQVLNTNVGDVSIRMNGDSIRIAQALANLLGNASKYSPDESVISMDVTVRPGAFDITITDRGIGISVEDQRNLFTPFFRADNEETRVEIGTRLGLVIVKRIVELHGGKVRIDSEKGVGTTAHISLPAIDLEA